MRLGAAGPPPAAEDGGDGPADGGADAREGGAADEGGAAGPDALFPAEEPDDTAYVLEWARLAAARVSRARQ